MHFLYDRGQSRRLVRGDYEYVESAVAEIAYVFYLPPAVVLS